MMVVHADQKPAAKKEEKDHNKPAGPHNILPWKISNHFISLITTSTPTNFL